jgi:hypothetical protein
MKGRRQSSVQAGGLTSSKPEKCFGSLLSGLFLFAKMVFPERKLPRVGRRNTAAVFDTFQRFRKEFFDICVSLWLRLLNFRRISET